MAPTPASPRPRHPTRRRIVLGVVAAVIVVLGVVVGKALFGSESSTVTRLEKVLDAVPLPPGTSQTGQETDAASSPVTVTRTYDLADARQAGPAIVSALRAARYRSVTLVGGEDDPQGWADATRTPAEGDVTVLPPGYHGTGGVQLEWDGGALTVTVDDVAFPRNGSS